MGLRKNDFSYLLLPWLLGLLLVFPYLLIFFEVGQWTWPQWETVGPVLRFTLWQAFLSALFSLLLGSVGALGLMSLRRPQLQMFVEAFVLLPNIVPQLLVIIAAINSTTIFVSFPFGLWGVVIIHTLLNAGLVSMAVVRLLRSKVGGMAELAYVEGASLSRFLWQVAFPYLKRDMALLGLFVFSMCFTSFAVPLIVGGVSGTTIEVLIYEKIRIGANWSEALSLSFLQIFFILLFSVFLFRQDASLKFRALQEQFLARRWALLLCLAPSAFVFMGLFSGLAQGWEQLMMATQIWSELPMHLTMTALVGLGTGLLSLLLLCAVAYVFPHPKFQAILRGYASPSAVIMGFAMLLWGGHSTSFTLVKLVLGITLISFPTIYRWLGESSLQAIQGQVWVARSLGASSWQIFSSIVLPQVIYSFALVSGVAAFWACGDFAYSSIVASSDLTLALLIEDLMSSYRLEMATVLVWPLLVCGALCFFALGGLGFVLGRKSHS